MTPKKKKKRHTTYFRGDRKEFIDRIAFRMELLKINRTASDLASELKIPKQTLAHWTNGRGAAPMTIIEALADKLGVLPCDIITNKNQLELFGKEEDSQTSLNKT